MSSSSVTLLEAINISHQFDGQARPLFSNIDISLVDQCQALLGRNGVGKLYLASILAAKRLPSSGLVKHYCEVAYYAQDMHRSNPSHLTGADILGVSTLLSAYRRVLAGDGSTADFTLLDGHWDIEQRIAQLLAEGQLADAVLTQSCTTLSGGELTRLHLLALKQQHCRFLILDEASNHLDYQGRQWLAQWLANYDGGVLLITHDYKLLAQVSTIYELSGLGLQKSTGGLEAYQQTRTQLRLGAQRQLQQSKKQLDNAQRIKQKQLQNLNSKHSAGKRARAQANQSKLILNNNQARAEKTQLRLTRLHEERTDQAKQELQQARQQVEDLSPLAIVLTQAELASNPVIHFADVELPYGCQQKLSFTLNRGDRLALIGNNGSGKSTLLKLLTGTVKAISGEVKRHACVRLLDQHLSLLDKTCSALLNFKRLAPGWPDDQYRTRLAQFRLRAERALLPVAKLSGGEQLKVALACLFCGPTAPVVLLLDEPDNHLDIESKELLQFALSRYTGVLVVVSHDQHFIQQVGVSKTINLNAKVK